MFCQIHPNIRQPASLISDHRATLTWLSPYAFFICTVYIFKLFW